MHRREGHAPPLQWRVQLAGRRCNAPTKLIQKPGRDDVHPAPVVFSGFLFIWDARLLQGTARAAEKHPCGMDEQLARILVQPLGRAQQRQRAGKAILLQFMQRLGVRFAQHVVDRVDRPLALLRLQPGQPLLERPVEEAAGCRS